MFGNLFSQTWVQQKPSFHDSFQKKKTNILKDHECEICMINTLNVLKRCYFCNIKICLQCHTKYLLEDCPICENRGITDNDRNDFKNHRLLLNDKSVIKYPQLFLYLDITLQRNKNFILHIFHQSKNKKLAKYIPEDLWNDPFFVKKCIKICPQIYCYFPSSLKYNKKLSLYALRKGVSLNFIPKHFQFCSSFFVHVLRQGLHVSKTFNDLPSKLRKNWQVIWYYIGKYGPSILDRVPVNYLTNIYFCYNAIKHNVQSYCYASNEVRHCDFIIDHAIKKGISFKSLPESFRQNKKKAIKYFLSTTHSNSFENFPNAFRKDPSIIQAAVDNTPRNIIFANESMKNDESFILKILSRKSEVFKFLSEKNRGNIKIATFAIDLNPKNILYTAYPARHNGPLVTRAIISAKYLTSVEIAQLIPQTLYREIESESNINCCAMYNILINKLSLYSNIM